MTWDHWLRVNGASWLEWERCKDGAPPPDGEEMVHPPLAKAIAEKAAEAAGGRDFYHAARGRVCFSRAEFAAVTRGAYGDGDDDDGVVARTMTTRARPEMRFPPGTKVRSDQI